MLFANKGDDVMSDRPTLAPTRKGGAPDMITKGEYAWCFTKGMGLPVGRWLSKFEVYAYLQHGGDMAKAEQHVFGKSGA